MKHPLAKEALDQTHKQNHFEHVEYLSEISQIPQVKTDIRIISHFEEEKKRRKNESSVLKLQLKKAGELHTRLSEEGKL